MTYEDSNLTLDAEGNPILPALRTFLVRRPNATTMGMGMAGLASGLGDDEVEAHRYYVDNTGALCFERVIWLQERGALVLGLPRAMAPGTWWDVTEIMSPASRAKLN